MYLKNNYFFIFLDHPIFLTKYRKKVPTETKIVTIIKIGINIIMGLFNSAARYPKIITIITIKNINIRNI